MADTMRPEAQESQPELPFITKEELSGDASTPSAKLQDTDPTTGPVEHSTESSTAIQDEVPPRHRIVESQKKKGRVIGAVSAAVALLGAGLFIGSRLASQEPEERLSTGDPVETSTPGLEETPTTTANNWEADPSITAPDSEEVIDPSIYGNIHLRDLPLGNNFITAVRPNGEVIRVPYLRGDTPIELANSALALWSCALSTGSEECIQAFSLDSAVQEDLRVRWQELETNYFDPDQPEGLNAQWAFVDLPSDPAVFSLTNEGGQQVLELVDGTLYGAHISTLAAGTYEWMGSQVHNLAIEVGGLPTTFYELRLFIEPVGDQSLTVGGMEVVARPTES